MKSILTFIFNIDILKLYKVIQSSCKIDDNITTLQCLFIAILLEKDKYYNLRIGGWCITFVSDCTGMDGWMDEGWRDWRERNGREREREQERGRWRGLPTPPSGSGFGILLSPHLAWPWKRLHSTSTNKHPIFWLIHSHSSPISHLYRICFRFLCCFAVIDDYNDHQVKEQKVMIAIFPFEVLTCGTRGFRRIQSMAKTYLKYLNCNLWIIERKHAKNNGSGKLSWRDVAHAWIASSTVCNNIIIKDFRHENQWS